MTNQATASLSLLRRILEHLNEGKPILPGGLAHREIDTVLHEVESPGAKGE